MRSIDGGEATVELTTVSGESETKHDLTVTPDTLKDEVRRLPDDHYYLVDTIFPFEQLGDLNLEALSVGDTRSGPAGSEFQVTGSGSHDGIDCLKIEHVVGDRMLSSWCVSIDHAMVIKGESSDPAYKLVLDEWRPS